MKVLESKLTPELMKKIQIIGEKQGSISLSDLAQELSLGTEETLIFLRQVFPEGNGVEIYTENGHCVVDIDASALNYMLPLTPGEWLSLHQILSQILSSDSHQNPSLTSLIHKVVKTGPVKAVMELLNQLEMWNLELNQIQKGYITVLDQAVAEKRALSFSTINHKSYRVIPCRIIHLEGRLSMIAEDLLDHCMMVVPVGEIAQLDFIELTTSPRVSSFEVDELIAAIRSMNEKETRLILKIHDPQSLNLFPDHHFLGKPCMITNPSGDLIWAAYVEPGDDLYEWLLTLGKNVEILDPANFKDHYLAYCSQKLRKVA